MPLRDSDFIVGAVVPIMGEEKGGDSGGIGFKSQANQLIKQRDVFHEVAVLRFFDGGFGLGD